MFERSLYLIALTAFVSVAAATQATAGSCCGCAYTCAPPAQVRIWGLSPSYMVNHGPVYTGPGYYTSPTYEAEVSTADYPYVGYDNYPRYRPYDGGPYSDPFRHHIYHHYRHETGLHYRHGFGPRAITMSGAEHWMSRSHRFFRDPRDR